LIEVLDDTIHGSDEIDRYLGLPVLGVIRKIDGSQAVIAAIKPRSPASEDFRSLRTNIQFASVDYPLRSILITSPTPEDGKTVIATNLSIILAQGGQQVALIDADLRRPRVHQYMQIPNKWGLSYLFTSKDERLDGVLRKNKSLGLSIMTAGNLPPNPAELLGSEKMNQIIAEVKNQSDVIVFDSPPLNAVTDASVLSKLVDGVIVVVKAGSTKIIAAQQALEQLQRVGANVIGVVLNNVNMKKARYSTYYSYYSDYSETIANDKKQRGVISAPQRKKGLSR
jgi:non-specific protein-tyrosine kinase